MFSRRISLAALASVAAAVAIVAPAASAATTPTPTVDPQVCQLLTMTQGPFGPAQFLGGASLADVLSNAGGMVGCAAPAPQPSMFPGGL
jgi:hypothetical protein